MRVTHVITRLIVGGAQENTVSSVLGLHEKPDLKVDLISGPTFGREGSLESRFDHTPGVLSLLPELVRPIRPVKDVQALRKLTGIFRAWRPDLVHTHSGKAGVVGRLAAARAGVPIIVHTIHGPSFGPFQGALANLVFRAAEQRAGHVTTHFVVVANAMTKQYLAAGIGRPEQYTRVLSGFDLAPFLNATNAANRRAALGLTPQEIVVGKIARLVPLKGHEDLIAIARELIAAEPRLKFLLVGDGELRPRFEELAQAAGVARHFVFTGLVAPTEVAPLVGLMDIVVHLSAREGLPRALPQALAAGRPVVAYDCDGAGEVCLDGQTGFLLSRGDRPSLKRRLLELAANPALRRQLGERGRELVRENFGVQRMVDDLHQLYLRLARARARL